jgi:hypothetical protein
MKIIVRPITRAVSQDGVRCAPICRASKTTCGFFARKDNLPVAQRRFWLYNLSSLQ